MDRNLSKTGINLQVTPSKMNPLLKSSPSFSASSCFAPPIQQKFSKANNFQEPTFQKMTAPFERNRSGSRESSLSNASRNSFKSNKLSAVSSNNLYLLSPKNSFRLTSQKTVSNKEGHQKLQISANSSTQKSQVGYQDSASRPLPPEEYYAYWKKKAHEYLQVNMQLIEEAKGLKKVN